MNSKLEGLKYITPFKYFTAQSVINGGRLEPLFVILSFVLIAALISITYLFYKNRDLNV